MRDFEVKCDTPNQKLYEFLATSYDIGNLARKIDAEKNAPNCLLNLKKMVSNENYC